MNRVHIIGPPRSGTTLMLELMITGFEFSISFKEEMSLLNLPENMPLDASVCTKKPTDHRLVKQIIEKDNCQWFISMVRDPRDIVVSRHDKHPNVYWANFWQWRDWLNNTTAYKRHPRLIEVSYEKLAQSPDVMQQQLAERLPFLRRTHRFSDYHKYAVPSRQSLAAMGGLRPVNNASVGNWRKHLARIAGQLQIHGSITQELIDLGFEQDDTWLKLLDGVEPNTRPGRWPEFMATERFQRFNKRQDAQLRKYLQRRGL